MAKRSLSSALVFVIFASQLGKNIGRDRRRTKFGLGWERRDFVASAFTRSITLISDKADRQNCIPYYCLLLQLLFEKMTFSHCTRSRTLLGQFWEHSTRVCFSWYRQECGTVLSLFRSKNPTVPNFGLHIFIINEVYRDIRRLR